MINDNLLWTADEYEAVVDYKANGYNRINVLLSSEVTKRETEGKFPKKQIPQTKEELRENIEKIVLVYTAIRKHYVLNGRQEYSKTLFRGTRDGKLDMSFLSTSDSARTAFDFAKMFERMKEGTGTLLAIDSGDVPWINISDVIPSDDGIEDEPEILFLPTQAEGFEQISLEELFNIAMKLISSPAKAWEEISMEEDRRKVFMAFVYPMIGLCGLSVFIGSLLTNGWGGPQSFQIAMTNCCAVAVALFGGYFLAAYAINEMGTRMFGMHSNMPLTQQFAGYALVVPFLLQIVTGLLPDFRIIAWLLQFYIVYVVWEGAPIMMKVEEKQRLKYTLLSSVLLILCPTVIQIVFSKLIAILN